MKKENKTPKTESRLKSKFESLKKLPHATSATSVLDKARAFFRSLELKHHHHRQEQSTIQPLTTSSNEDHQKKDFLLNPIPPTTNISTSRIPRVEKINPRDIIVHRVIHNDDQLSSNYFQQKYRKYLKPSLLIPKQYYNEILNKRYTNYSTSLNRHDLYPRSSISTLSSNSRYRSFHYSTTHNEIPSPHFQPFVCREIESPYNELSFRPITRPSPSTAPILTWNQCVRRLNTEYKLTIDALQQAKECLERIHYLNSTSHRNNEIKKPTNVTFYLPTLSTSNRSPSLSISKSPIEQNKTFPFAKFCTPKLVKPVQLNTFSSLSKLEPTLTITENNEKLDSITNIIQKLNDLNNSLSPINKETSTFNYPNTNPRVHFKPLITTYELTELSDLSPPISSSSEIVSSKTEDQSEDDSQEEEETTTYTVETFYKSTENDRSSNNQNIVVIQENTTEEQFNLVHQEIPKNQSPLMDDTSSNNTTVPVLLDSKSTSSSTPLEKKNKSISHIPKRITTTTTTSIPRLKQSSKMLSTSSKLRPPSSTITNSTPASIRKSTGNNKIPLQVQNQRNHIHSRSSSTTKKQPSINSHESQTRTDPPSSNRVKSMVHPPNTPTLSRPSKRPSRSSVSKTIIPRK